MKTIAVATVPALAILIVLAAGCMGTAPATQMAPSVTTAMTVAAASTSSSADPWSGTWDCRLSTPRALQTFSTVTMARVDSSVTGTYSNDDHGTGNISGTVLGNTLSGTWTVNYGTTRSDSGQFVFTLSDDGSSFYGTWVSASDKENTLDTTEDYWEGTRR